MAEAQEVVKGAENAKEACRIVNRIMKTRPGLALAAILQGDILVWFLSRPSSEPVTTAAPLPMIDIALSAPAVP